MDLSSSRIEGRKLIKSLLSQKSIVTVTLLTLLLLNVFAWITHLVNATVVKDPTILINGSGSIEITWKSGKSQTYSSNAYTKLGGLELVTITPSPGWHIDTLLIDGNPQGIIDEDGFNLIDIQAKSMVSVAFLENCGVDDVDTGTGVVAYPDPNVGLFFDDVLADGYVYAFVSGLELFNQIGESWDIWTNATFDPDITVYLVCTLDDLPEGLDPYDLALWRTVVHLGDVNLDGKVDGTDESIVANANPSEPADSALDLNDDGRIDNDDVTIVAHNIGLESVWEQLESWVILDGNLVYVYGITEHLSIYGVTRKS